LAHPLPGLAVAVAPPLAVNVGAERVGITPVGVYDGRTESAPPLLIDAGGHANAAVAVAGMFPAPAPPVW
jgi:hypothetical protein